jgi:hypothetical protein
MNSSNEEYERRIAYVLVQAKRLAQQSSGPLKNADNQISANISKPDLKVVQGYLDELEHRGKVKILERNDPSKGGWQLVIV